MERFLRYSQICVEKLPLEKIRKNKPKIEMPYLNFLLSEIYKFCLWIYVFIDDKLAKISLRITKDVKIQDGRQLWLKNRSWY